MQDFIRKSIMHFTVSSYHFNMIVVSLVAILVTIDGKQGCIWWDRQ